MKRIIFALSVIVLTANPAFAESKQEKPVELSDSEISALQSKTYDAPYSVLFPAVMSTLQSSNYANINANRDSGTATAETEAKSKLVYNIIWGFGKKKRTQLASIFMEELNSKKSILKLKLSIIETKNRVGLGGGYSDGSPVKFAEPYQDFYAQLQSEVTRRMGAITATETAAEPVATASVTPATTPAH